MPNLFQEGLVFSFANQKGGVGKSTLTSIFANYLFTTGKNNNLNMKIAVIDADDLQQTLSRKRERELSEYRQALKEAEEKGDKKQMKILSELMNAYKVISMSSSDIGDNIDFLKEEYDIIIIDLPGNLLQEGIITTYYLIDVIIMPFQPNEFDLDSTSQFYELMTNKVIKQRKELGYETSIAGVLNRVKPKTLEFKEIYEGKDGLPYFLLNTYIKDSTVQYQRKVTTLGDGLADEDFCEEILEFIMKHNSNKNGN